MRILLSIFLLLPSLALALDFGKVGTTYPIKEKDLLVAIEEKASAVDWKSVFASEAERLKKTLGLVNFTLAVATENESRFVDLTTTLERNIQVRDPNGQLRTIYPKGFRYNVLEHIEFPDVFVILNASRQSELDWYQEHWLGKDSVYPIVSQGDVLALTNRYKNPFTKINQIFIDKFQIEATPTVMQQDGKLLRLDEILIKEGDTDEK
jgi:conjugal transfer pilus assembly protein TraW